MAIPTNASDVFEMAVGMERIGKDFYEALALGSDKVVVRDFCLKAARDEANHLAAFRQMRDLWAMSVKRNRVAPEVADALAAVAKGRIQPRAAAVRKVAMGGSLKDALDMAMRMEQDSIDFYQELSARLPDSADVIQRIVEEEEKHLGGLRQLGA
jgi:rubrerythrin